MERYPNLDNDTQPGAILAKLRESVPRGSVVYVATNEKDPGTFYRALREVGLVSVSAL